MPAGASDRVDAWFANAELRPWHSRVTEYKMHEAVSQLFEIELRLTLRDVEKLALDPEEMQKTLESPCAIGFGDVEAVGEPIFGVLKEWQILDHEVYPTSTAPPDGQPHEFEVECRAVVVPTLWYTTLTHRSRVFQDVSVPDIVKQVFDEAGLDEDVQYELHLDESYPKREYVVQYDESDYDFVARLLEHEGISFYFDHADGSDKVVLVDANAAFPDAAPSSLPYPQPRGESASEAGELASAMATLSPDSNGAATAFAGDYIGRLARSLEVVPRTVMIRESNYRTPRVPLQARSEIHETGLGLIALYGDHFKDDAEGRRIARVRAEERAVARDWYQAEGYVRSLRAGQVVKLAGEAVVNPDQRYLVTEIERESSDPDELDHTLNLVPVEVPFRPRRETARPRIYGLMHARVDGEVDGVPAPLDEEGRYRVLLPFDTAAEVGGQASRWMRRAQVYAGPGYGMHFPLHVGTEVLIAHIDGDPDRPVIAGAIPNPATASPVTSDNATQSIVRTKAHIVQEYEDDAQAS